LLHDLHYALFFVPGNIESVDWLLVAAEDTTWNSQSHNGTDMVILDWRNMQRQMEAVQNV